MAELFGAMERGLGAALSAFYGWIPNYGLAIVLVTIAVRILLIPLTVKQIRGMAAQQKLQPEMQKIRQKYKQLQQKAKDRMEVQQLRLQMNEEVQGLMKSHGVNPASGCLPLLAQMPFFIALFSIVRASLVAVPLAVTAINGTYDANTYNDEQLGSTVCRPVAQAAASDGEIEIECLTENGPTRRFRLRDFKDRTGEQSLTDVSYVTHCKPTKDGEKVGFICNSAPSTGHIPQDSRLFRDLSTDRASFFGMQPGCTPAQVGSDAGVRACTSRQTESNPGQVLPYYLLVALIIASQYYQSKQMQARMQRQGVDLGPTAQSQQLSMKILPIVFGFLSFTLFAGANMYFLASNLWTIGQQHVLFKRQEQADKAEEGQTAPRKLPKGAVPDPEPAPERPAPKTPGQPNPNASKKRKKKKR